mgnify:CR=1 FL=1
MSEPKPLGMSFADFLTQIAGKTGLKVRTISPSAVVVPFDMGEGRTQYVWVRAVGTDGRGNLLVGIYSPALKMPEGQLLSREAANELLRENINLAHGSWAIQKMEDGEYLVMFDTQIAQTMDPEEFAASVRGLAAAADAKEKSLGSDAF